MGWVSIALTVVGYIIKYGPKLWKLGLEVYEMVEEMKKEWKRKHPDKPEAEVKEEADKVFDEKVVSLSSSRLRAVPASATRRELRRDVWGSRPENHKKVRQGKTARKGGR